MTTDTTETGIIPSVPIDRLLAQRDAALTALRRIRDAVLAYQSIGEQIGLGEGAYKFREPISRDENGRTHGEADAAWFEWAAKTLDTSLWAHLIDKSGLRTFMDATARERWNDQIGNNKTPPLTPENVAATFKNLYESRGDMFAQGVLNVYAALSWDHKTNRPVRFGKRLILKYVRDCHGFANHRQCDRLDDLLRALHVLDKQPEPDHRNGAYSALGGRFMGPPPTWETDYFTLKTFKNGNGHLTFKRADLVDGLNRILAQQRPDALPPTDEPAPSGNAALAV